MSEGMIMGFVINNEVLETIFMSGGVLISLPFMVIRHKMLEKLFKFK